MLRALMAIVGARHHEELAAWQLARQLHREVVKFTATGLAAKDFKFCDQIRSSSSSVPANIAEGFWRYRPKDFARFLAIARGSLGETQNQLRDALERNYVQRRDFDRLWNLSQRAIGATSRLLTYLRHCSAPRARRVRRRFPDRE